MNLKTDCKYTDYVFSLVKAERIRQNEKYTEDRNLDPKLWLTVLAEEFGEIARAILERDPQNLEEELIQVAAVAVAWLEDLEYRKEETINARNKV